MGEALFPVLHETKLVYKIFKNLLIFVFDVFIYCYKHYSLMFTDFYEKKGFKNMYKFFF